MNKSRLLLLCGTILLLSQSACGRKGPLFLEKAPPKAVVLPAPVMQPASSPVSVNQPPTSR